MIISYLRPYLLPLNTFITINRKDWLFCFSGAIFSMLLGSYFISGIFLPQLQHPYILGGDALQFLLEIQRLMEEGLAFNSRLGFPFGSTFLDFSTSEEGHLFLLQILGKASGSATFSFNAYVLLSFFFNFISTYLVSRAFGLSISSASACAFLFNFLPFHFLRIGHLFYILYFHIPIYFFLAYTTFIQNPPIKIKSWMKNNFLILLSLFIFSSFGIYYAFFACILFIITGIASAVKNNSARSLLKELLCVLSISLGVIVNTVPSIVYDIEQGKNPEVAQRHFSESEHYGLRLAQLVLPRDNHRLKPLAHFKGKYTKSAPLVTENSTVSLGFFGSMGFLYLLCGLFFLFQKRDLDPRIALFSLSTYSLFLISTMGGFSVLFSMLITPSIRGWNRISPFIAFSSILTFCIILENFLKRKNWKNFLKQIIWLGVITIGILDQTTPTSVEEQDQIKTITSHDRTTIKKIEDILPKGSAVFMYPYMPFPEWPYTHKLGTYDLAIAFLYSQNLKWNYGGMKGREGDLFYRILDKEPLQEQLNIIKKLGFQGIYIDKRGYEDRGKEIIKTYETLLGYPPTLISDDDKIAFFKLNNVPVQDFTRFDSRKIMDQVGFIADRLGKRYEGKIEEGIDFKREDLPSFLENIRGLSIRESWGRWSLGKKVKFAFNLPLPQKFKLTLNASAFGSNIGKKLEIRTGGKIIFMDIPSAHFEESIDIELLDKNDNTLTFVIPNPQSPGNEDSRKIGIGFISLKIESIEK
jgi:phosphoglycerol transferase